MFKKAYLYLAISILFLNNTHGQYKKQIDSLCTVCSLVRSDSTKILALDKLAEYYYIYQLNSKADSILGEEIKIAELSNNSNLKFTALFGNAVMSINPSTTSEGFNHIEKFLESGIAYSKLQNRNEYIGIGYTRLANLLIKRGENEKALEKAKLAMESLQYISSDSLKAVIYIELGNAYKSVGELVSACTIYNTAFDIATKINSIPLLSKIYHAFSDIYSTLNIETVAKSELEKSLTLNKENNYGEGMVADYYDLARLTDEKFYIDKAIQVADSINNPYYILASKKLMVAYIMVKEKDSKKALTYLETEQDLKDVYLNSGKANYYNCIAEIYQYSENYDSALHYFKLAEYDFVNYFDLKSTLGFLFEIGETYQHLNDRLNAIIYFSKAMDISKKMNDLGYVEDLSNKLGRLYDQMGNFKEAYRYSRQAIDYQNQIRIKSKENEIALLGAVRETRKHEEELQRSDLEMRRQRDLQYMFISILIGIIFLSMLVLGAFPVSRTAIRMLGYFFFISLFEFIILFIDNIFLGSNIHHEPLKLWIIKIALIAILVPIQHYMEHHLIKFLQSRKLLEARTHFSFKAWWKKINKSSPNSGEDIEDDTAVL